MNDYEIAPTSEEIDADVLAAFVLGDEIDADDDLDAEVVLGGLMFDVSTDADMWADA